MPAAHRPTLMLIAGTRPEALKLCSLRSALLAESRVDVISCWTGQQPTPPAETQDWPWLRLPPPAHPLRRGALECSLGAAIERAAKRLQPQALLVQGDTASAYAGARAAWALGLPLVHLEAGLRSGQVRAPFPEEAYRRSIARLAALHLAPSERAAAQLLQEGVSGTAIAVVGSTAVDGLHAQRTLPQRPAHDLLVDMHRRENAGRPLRRLALALRTLTRSGWRIGLIANPNSWWRQRWSEALGADSGVEPLPLLDRAGWLGMAQSARAVLSDSGAAAEELPYLGVPLLMYRCHSERMEALESGHAVQLHPHGDDALDVSIERALTLHRWPDPWPLCASSPYGDGHAGARAAQTVAHWLVRIAQPPRQRVRA